MVGDEGGKIVGDSSHRALRPWWGTLSKHSGKPRECGGEDYPRWLGLMEDRLLGGKSGSGRC